MRSVALAALILPLAVPAFADAVPAPQAVVTATAELQDSEQAAVGMATLTEGPAGVVLRLEMGGLMPGWHGLHLHEKGDCSDAAAGFKASGAHVGHGNGAVHGLLNPEGPEAGDLPNLFAAEDGSAHAEMFIPGATIAGLTDSDGTAILVHSGEDDHHSQPIGGAGGRVACGVMEKSS